LNRRTTGLKDETEAKKYALDIERALGRATSPDSEQKSLMLDTMRSIAKEVNLLDQNQLTGDPAMTSVKWFTQDFRSMSSSRGDDAKLEQSSLERIDRAFTDFTKFLEAKNLLNVPLGRITKDDIIKFMNLLKLQGLCGSTRKWILNRIKGSFSRAVAEGIILTNPASGKATGKMRFHTQSIRRNFNTAQIELILHRIDDPKYKNYFPWMRLATFLAIFTQQAEAEICRMKWEHIRDFNGDLPILEVRDRKKTEAGSETPLLLDIPIADPLRDELLKVPKAQRKGYLLPVDVCESFQARRKRRFQRPWLTLFRDLEKQLVELWGRQVVSKIAPAGERGRTRYAWAFHSFRHMGGKFLSGADLHYLLGHRSDKERAALGTTVVYQHEDLQRIKKALDGIPLTTPRNVVAFRREQRRHRE
jgi:integrase